MTTYLRVFAVLLLCAAGLAAQQPPPGEPQQAPPVTFRVEVNYVEVDATVTDEQGNVVTNLTSNDFEVLEDGKPQKITAFALVNIPVERADPLRFATTPIESDVQTNRRVEGRVFLIVLDSYHTSPLNALRVKGAARGFVERLGVNDVAAVVHTSGRSDYGQDFTSNRRLLIASIDKFMGEASSATLSRLDAFTRESPAGPGNPTRSNQPNVYDPEEMERQDKSTRSLRTLTRLAEYMAGVRGRRKALVLISEGLPYDMADAFNSGTSRVFDEFRAAIGAASRSNVSIYTVDPKGLDTGTALGIEISGFQGAIGDDPNSRPDEKALGIGVQSLMSESRLAQDSLRTLAEQTGGIAAVNRNDFAGAFDTIMRDNSTYYMLGYYPTNEKRDGKFRKIELRMKRPGLRVRSRRGYTAPRGRAPETKPSPAAGSPALREAADSPLPMSGIAMSAFAAPFKGTPPNAAVMVSLELQAGAFRYREQNGAFANTLEVLVNAIDSTGKNAGGKRHTVKLNFSPKLLEDVKTRGFRLVSQVDLPPGHYQLRIAAAELNDNTAGSVLYDLEVPDLWKSPLTMSGLVVMSADASATPTTGPQNQFGAALAGPPATRREFTRDDEIALFAEVYENAPDAPAHQVDITATVRGADGRILLQSTEQRSSTELQSGRGGYGFSVNFPLKEIAPGTYLLRLEARSRAGNNIGVARDVQIRIK